MQATLLYIILKTLLYHRINSHQDQVLSIISKQTLKLKKERFFLSWVLQLQSRSFLSRILQLFKMAEDLL